MATPPLYSNYYNLPFRGLNSPPTLADLIQVEKICYMRNHKPDKGGLGRPGHFKNFVNLIWNNPELKSPKQFIWNPWADHFFETACHNAYIAVAGSACVSANTRLLNPLTGEEPTIKQLCDTNTRPWVQTLNGPILADVPYLKGREKLFRFTLDNGSSFECTGKHILLTPLGWSYASSVCLGDSIYKYVRSPQETTSGNDQLSRQQGVHHYSQKVVSSTDGCSVYFHLCGEQLQSARGSALSSLPSPDDVRKYSECVCERLGGFSDVSECNHLYLSNDLSTHSVSPLSLLSGTPDLPLGGAEIFSPQSPLSQQLEPFLKENILQHSFSTPDLRSHHMQNMGCADVLFEELLSHSFEGCHGESSCLLPSDRTQGGYYRAYEKVESSDCCAPVIACGLKSSWRLEVSHARVVSIEEIGVHDFYDLNVPQEHHYFAEGVIHHNSSGKSDPAALWALGNYLLDPTHTKVIVMSTTLQGAKMRIWKTLKEYWEALPDPPGKANWSLNMIKGLGYDGRSLSDSSGIVLLASEKSKERAALDSLIGIKAPATQGPNGRIGKLIMIVDEMTGCSESILNAAYSNLSKNRNFQLIGLGNPDSRFDAFGLFAKPKEGWDTIDLDSSMWKTERGVCIRFDGLKNPRITEPNEKYFWMPSREAIELDATTYGRNSPFFYRMIRGMWVPDSASQTIYSETEFINAKAMDRIVWGTEKPIKVAFCDPSFTEGGDRAIVYYGSYGVAADGRTYLQFDGYDTLVPDLTDKSADFNYQMVRLFREHCRARGVLPQYAAFDSTGGGGPWGSIVHQEWDHQVTGINFSGSATARPVSKTDKTPAKERYANRMTEIWYSAKPLLAAGMLRNLDVETAREICKREHAASNASDTRKLRVESKRELKKRTNESPDLGDAALGLIEFCRMKFGFRAVVSTPTPYIIGEQSRANALPTPHKNWNDFVARNKMPVRRLSR